MGTVVAYLLSGFVIDAIGRRQFLFVAYLGSLIMVPITYWLLRSPEAVIAAGFVNGFFTLGWVYSCMAIYPSELFTSSVRSTAISFVFNATRLLAWIFPIAAGTMIQSLGGTQNTALILGSVYVVGLIVPWFLPATKGHRLPE